jgi:hypothetical protein
MGPHAPEIVWSPHPMDGVEKKAMCRQGGPGGFGCCDDCYNRCTQYMVATFADMYVPQRLLPVQVVDLAERRLTLSILLDTRAETRTSFREKQKVSNIGLQVQQLTEISAVFSRRLEQTVRATRRKPTPLLLAYRRPQEGVGPAAAAAAAAGQSAAAKPSLASLDSFGPDSHEV